jgi:Spy/CpxP family protein refolding chaperone
MKRTLGIFFIFCVLISGAAVKAGERQEQANKPAVNHPLSEAQMQAIKSILAESKKKAAPVALRLGLTAKQVYENILSDKPDEAVAERLSKEMKEVVGELVSIRGQSMREAVKVLTPEQKQLLKSEMAKPGAPADLMELIVHLFNIPEK